jgi:hypothetical protein
MTDKEVRDAIRCIGERHRERMRASHVVQEKEILEIQAQCPHGKTRRTQVTDVDDSVEMFYICSACGKELPK